MRSPVGWAAAAIVVLGVLFSSACSATVAKQSAAQDLSFTCPVQFGRNEPSRPCSRVEFDAVKRKFALIDEAQHNHRQLLGAYVRAAKAGEARATSEMRSYLAAGMLPFYDGLLREQSDEGQRITGELPVTFIAEAPVETVDADLAWQVCEDGRSLEMTDKGKPTSYRGSIIQGIVYYRRIDGVVKLVGARSEQVPGCPS